MKYILTALLFVAVCNLRAQERKLGAILISNSSYTGPGFQSLSFPVNDLQKMHYLLLDLKIDSSLILKTTKVRTSDEFISFVEGCRKELAQKNVTDVIFYYSGHGVINNGESFLIPGDFRSDNFSSLYKDYNDNVKDYLSKINSASGEFEQEFRQQLQSLSLIAHAVPVSVIANNLKDFNLLFFSDACRSVMPSADKGVASTVNLDEYLKNWIKNNGNPNNQKKQAFYTAFKNFYSSLEDSLSKFNNFKDEFRNTLTDLSKRKPVTLFYGTNYYNSAKELSSLYSGAFTAVLDSVIRNYPEPFIKFNDDFNNILRNHIYSATQKPVIDGWRNFSIANPFLREQPMTVENLMKITSDRYYRVLKFNLVKGGISDNKNYLNTRKQLQKYFDRKQVEEFDGFANFFQDSAISCGKIRMDVFSRIHSMSLTFEGGNAILMTGQEETIMPSYFYQFDKTTCRFSIPPDTDLTSSNRNPHKFSRDVENETAFELIDNSTIKLNGELTIPGFGNFSEIRVKRISRDFDSVYLELPDMNSDVIVQLLLHASKNSRKVISGNKLPYKGELKDKHIKVASFNSTLNYFPNNTAVPVKWKNGKYTATLTMEVIPDSIFLNATTEELSAKKDFLSFDVNNVSLCTNPTAPLSKGANCVVQLHRAAFGAVQVKQERNNLSVSASFEIIDSDPASLKISMPFSFNYPDHIKEVIVHSLLIDHTEEYSAAKVNGILDNIKKANEAKLKELQNQALEQKRSKAKTERPKELVNYRLQTYAELFNSWKMEFTGNNTWYFNFNYGGRPNSLVSAIEQSNQLEIMQGYNYNYYEHGNMGYNYQVETDISFSETGGSQYFMFGAEQNAANGYYVYPANINNQFFLVLGYKQAHQNRELGRVNISDIDYSLARDFSLNNFSVKVTVRKHDDYFYLFFDEKFAGKIQYRDYPMGPKMIFKNDVPVSTPMNTNLNWLVTSNKKVFVRNFRISEIMDIVPLD